MGYNNLAHRVYMYMYLTLGSVKHKGLEILSNGCPGNRFHTVSSEFIEDISTWRYSTV